MVAHGLCSSGLFCLSNISYERFSRRSLLNPFRFYAFWLYFNPLNAELNPICHLLALLGAHHILHVSRIRVNCYCNEVYCSQDR